MGRLAGDRPRHERSPGGVRFSEKLEKLREVVASTKREIDVEFEKASQCMMRAFEAYQRCEVDYIDGEIEHDDITREMGCVEPQHRVAVALAYVLRQIATSPTGVRAAAAVATVLDDCEIERHASDGKAH